MKTQPLEPPRIEVVPVKLTEESWQRLRRFLDEKINEEFTGRDEAAWQKHILQYNSRLIPPAQDAYDAQVDTSLSRDRAQQFIAYILNPIFQQDQVFVAVPRWGTQEEQARAMNALADYVSDVVADHQFAYDLLEQAVVLPASPYVVVWEQKRSKVKEFQTVEEPVVDEAGEPIVSLDEQTGEMIPETRQVWKEVEKVIEHPPRARPICIPLSDFAMDGENADDAHHVFWRVWMTKEDIADAVRRGDYEPDILDKIAGVGAEKEREGVRLDSEDANVPQTVKRGKYYEVFECYLRWDVDGDGEEEEIVCTYMRDTGTRLRCVYNWWHRFKRPFGHFTYKPLPGTWYGQSLMYICEPFHRIHGAQLRLRLGSAVNAVEPLVIDRSGVLKEFVRHGRLKRGYVHARGLGSIREDFDVFYLGQNIGAESSLAQLGQEVGNSLDSLVGITPYLRGIEAIQRPTASGQMALIEAGKQTLYLAMDRFARELARMHNIRIAMYRQFFPSGLEVFIRHADQGTQQVMSTFVEWPEDEFIIETKVSSATMNLNIRKQETLALLDKFPEVMNNIAKLAQDATQPTPFAPVARELLRAYIETVRMWLTDFRANSAELLPRIDETMEEADVLAMVLQENEQLRAAIEMAGGGLPGGGLGGDRQTQGNGGMAQPPPPSGNGEGPQGDGDVVGSPA